MPQIMRKARRLVTCDDAADSLSFYNIELYRTLDEETYEPVVLARYFGYELLLDSATAPLFTSETPVAEAEFDPDAAGMSYAEYTAIYEAAAWLAQKQAEDPVRRTMAICAMIIAQTRKYPPKK